VSAVAPSLPTGLPPLPPPPLVSSPAPTPGPTLITEEEFLEKYAHRYADLVDGHLVEFGMPNQRHGEVCSEAHYILTHFVKERQLGRTLTNDAHIRISQNPDKVRGPDISYFSFTRMPPGPAPNGPSGIIPELCVEVRSPSNTWSDIFIKVGEYIGIGVNAVLVLDPDTQTASVYRGDGHQQIFRADDELTLPEVLPGFAVPVRRFFA
jgi:Uma2 family endonuclease